MWSSFWTSNTSGSIQSQIYFTSKSQHIWPLTQVGTSMSCFLYNLEFKSVNSNTTEICFSNKWINSLNLTVSGDVKCHGIFTQHKYAPSPPLRIMKKHILVQTLFCSIPGRILRGRYVTFKCLIKCPKDTRVWGNRNTIYIIIVVVVTQLYTFVKINHLYT